MVEASTKPDLEERYPEFVFNYLPRGYTPTHFVGKVMDAENAYKEFGEGKITQYIREKYPGGYLNWVKDNAHVFKKKYDPSKRQNGIKKKNSTRITNNFFDTKKVNLRQSTVKSKSDVKSEMIDLTDDEI